MNYDLILEELGEFGAWQKMVAVLLWLPAIIDGVEIMLASVTGLSPNQLRCKYDLCNNDDGSFFPEYDSDFENNDNILYKFYPKKDDAPDFCSHYQIQPDADGFCDFENPTIWTNVTKKCGTDSTYYYDKFDMDNSYITDFDIVCDKEIMLPIVNSLFMIGLMAGSFIFGVASDKFGRKAVLIPAIICAAGGSLIQGFMPEFYSFTLFRLIAGAGAEGCFLIPFVLSMEVVGVKERLPLLSWVSYSTLLANFLSVPLAGGEALVSSFGYFIKQWKTLQYIMSGICLSFVLIYFLLPESPRWLISNGKYKEARTLMEKAAKRNGVKISEHLLADPGKSSVEGAESGLPEKSDDVETVKAGKDASEYGLSDMFHPSVWKISLVLFVCWPVITLLYYGISFAAEKFHLGGEDPFLGMILVSLIEVPAYLFLIVTQDAAGRKPLFVMCMLLPGVACLIAAFLPDGIFQTILVLFAKFGISAAFNLTYVYTIELYPTNIRNSAVGICSTMARFGGIAAPWISVYLPDQGSLPVWVPLFIYGITAFIGGSLALILPDTIGHSLPDTFEDLEYIKAHSKPMWKCATSQKEEES